MFYSTKQHFKDQWLPPSMWATRFINVVDKLDDILSRQPAGWFTPIRRGALAKPRLDVVFRQSGMEIPTYGGADFQFFNVFYVLVLNLLQPAPAMQNDINQGKATCCSPTPFDLAWFYQCQIQHILREG